MTKEQEQVKQFMQTFGQETPDKPTIPSLEIRKLRAKLILEEALETIKGLGIRPELIEDFGVKESDIEIRNMDFIEDDEPSLIEIADGLADLHYVGYCGAAVACGLDMEPIFSEINRSNLTKLWTRKEVLDEDEIVIFVAEIKGLEVPKRFLVKDKAGKVLKSPSYSPANLEPFVK